MKRLLVALLMFACDVPILRPDPAGLGDAGADQLCQARLVIAATDSVQSANIGLMDGSGTVLSSSILSTASSPVGLTTALGGDLVFPTSPSNTSEIVVLDRFPRSVLTWLDVTTASVRAQLSVATGFSSNLHDYVQLSHDRALVTRFDSNPRPGREAFDAGGDLLVIDPSRPAILRRIDVASALPKEPPYFPHPDRAVLSGHDVFVVVPYYDSNHYSGSSYLALIDPDTENVRDWLRLPDASGCSGIAPFPNHQGIAVICSGRWQGTLKASSMSSSVVGVGTSGGLHEIWRVQAGSTDGRAFGFVINFADADHVVLSRQGQLGPPVLNDSIELIDVRTGSRRNLLDSAGQPSSLTVGPCLPSCGQCFFADASRGQVVRADFGANGQPTLHKFSWPDPVGLSPHVLCTFGTDPAP